MKNLLVTVFLLFFCTCFAHSQDMHRKWGASVMLGIGVKTVSHGGRDDNVGTVIKPGATGGLNLRLRLSPKSSLQLSGNIDLDRYTILGHIENHFNFFNWWRSDTTYSTREYGDLELEEISWQGILAYRYTVNHKWGASLGLRLGGVLKESGSYSGKKFKQYRRVENEVTLIEDVDVNWEDGWYSYENINGGLQANLYYQVTRRLQLMASFDTPMPFVYYDYSATRYKLVLAHRLF